MKNIALGNMNKMHGYSDMYCVVVFLVHNMTLGLTLRQLSLVHNMTLELTLRQLHRVRHD